MYPGSADTLVAARLAAELREYAGRLGSQFTAALTTGKPLARDEEEGAWEVRGRVYELRNLISVRLLAPKTDVRIVAANHLMETTYFGEDFAFVASVNVPATSTVPTESIRRNLRRDTSRQWEHRRVAERPRRRRRGERRKAARRGRPQLGRYLRRRRGGLCDGLRRAGDDASPGDPAARDTTRVITEIARGELHTVVPLGARRDEIGAVLAAVETLRKNSLEKAASKPSANG